MPVNDAFKLDLSGFIEYGVCKSKPYGLCPVVDFKLRAKE